MHLSQLHLRHFRNLADQQLDLPAEGVAIVGENAQGKTNLLEAIYYLETFRSFRGTRDDRLVAFGEEVFRVVGSLEGGGEGEDVEIAAAFQLRGRRKKVTVDGQEPERLGDGLGRLAAVVFSPADVSLVSDGPGARRRFLDIVLSLNEPGYLQRLQQFKQILSQRNAALRNGQGPETVDAWDLGLVAHGARVIEARLLWIERWQEVFCFVVDELESSELAKTLLEDLLDHGSELALQIVAYACETKKKLGQSLPDQIRERYTDASLARDTKAAVLAGIN